MSGPRSERDELERDGALAGVTEALERYAAISDESPSPGFADRVMAAIEAEPARRGWIAGWIAALVGPARHSLRVAAVAAVVVLAVGGALYGSQLAGLLRQQPGTASPSVAPSVLATPSVVPSPSVSPSPDPSESPEVSAGESEQPGSSAEESAAPGSSTAETSETPHPSGEDDGGGASPEPSGSSGGD